MSVRLRTQIQSKIPITFFFCCIVLILVIPLKTQFFSYDEGFSVFNATRIIDGDVPYRDFWAIYPPGQFSVLATLFRIFGKSLLVARLYDTIIRLVIVLCLYLIIGKFTFRPDALFVGFITAILLASTRFYTYAVFPSIALGLMAVLSILKMFNSGQLRWLFLSGMLVGTAALFRWDIAAYFGFILVFAIILMHDFPKSQLVSGRNFVPSYKIRAIVLFLGSAFLIIIPLYSIWGLVGGFENLWNQVIVFPATILHTVRWKPYPPLVPQIFPHTISLLAIKSAYSGILWWLRFYFPPVIFMLSISYYGLPFINKRKTVGKANIVPIILTSIGILLFFQALSRYDAIHVLPSSIFAFSLAIPLAHRLILKNNNRILKFSIYSFLCIFGFSYFLAPLYDLVDFLNNYSPLKCHSSVRDAGCIYLREDQEQAVDFITKSTSDDEPIFVGNQRHDLIFLNDIGFYFLANRPSATRYHELYPGVATTEPVQQEIVDDIQNKNVEWIVLVNFPASNEQNASSISSGVHLLDNFIYSNYVKVAEFGDYAIWRKSENPPNKISSNVK